MPQNWKLAVLVFCVGNICFIGFAESCLVKAPTPNCQHTALTTEDLITCQGYPVETHTVQTEDGYLLPVQRIPQGKDGVSNTNCTSRKPVLLVHGMFSSAACWVFNKECNNMAMKLANHCYDVWLGNSRGIDGTRHIKYAINEKKFWEFGSDEMALFDLPATIHYILNITGWDKLSYVGHSQGSRNIVSMLSVRQEYNDLLSCLVLLTPCASIGDIKRPIKYLANPILADPTIAILNSLDNGALNFTSDFVKFVKHVVCKAELFSSTICVWVFFFMFGANYSQLDMEQFHNVYLNFLPQATSVRRVEHTFQAVNKDSFSHFDYGSASENEKHYGQTTPPDYDMTKVTAPTVLVYSESDTWCTPASVRKMANKMPNVVRNYSVPLQPWTHLDFVWGKDVDENVNKEVLAILDKYQ